MSYVDWVRVGDKIVLVSDIKSVEISQLITEIVEVELKDGTKDHLMGFAALELVWLLKPSALEGNPGIKWKKHMWAIHNLFGHPVLQLLAWVNQYKWAIWIHDITVPKPIGYKNDKRRNK